MKSLDNEESVTAGAMKDKADSLRKRVHGDDAMAASADIDASELRVRVHGMSSGGRVFDPGLHPRGKDGKFIEKLGFVNFSLGRKRERGQVVGIGRGTGKNTGKIVLTVERKDGSTVDLTPDQVSQAEKSKADLAGNTPAEFSNDYVNRFGKDKLDRFQSKADAVNKARSTNPTGLTDTMSMAEMNSAVANWRAQNYMAAADPSDDIGVTLPISLKESLVVDLKKVRPVDQPRIDALEKSIEREAPIRVADGLFVDISLNKTKVTDKQVTDTVAALNDLIEGKNGYGADSQYTLDSAKNYVDFFEGNWNPDSGSTENRDVPADLKNIELDPTLPESTVRTIENLKTSANDYDSRAKQARDEGDLTAADEFINQRDEALKSAKWISLTNSKEGNDRLERIVNLEEKFGYAYNANTLKDNTTPEERQELLDLLVKQEEVDIYNPSQPRGNRAETMRNIIKELDGPTRNPGSVSPMMSRDEHTSIKEALSSAVDSEQDPDSAAKLRVILDKFNRDENPERDYVRVESLDPEEVDLIMSKVSDIPQAAKATRMLVALLRTRAQKS